jgi:hypothetical protein
MKNTAMNILVHTLLVNTRFHFCWEYPKSGSARLWNTHIFSLSKYCQTVLQSSCVTPRQCKSSSLLCSCQQLFFIFSHSGGTEQTKLL